MHIKTQLFSLIGRTVIVDGVPGEIVSKVPGRMRFGIKFGDAMVEMDRAEFILPPLRDRWPEWLDDEHDGFVYSNIPNF